MLRTVNNRYRYLDEMREAMVKWEAHIAVLLSKIEEPLTVCAAYPLALQSFSIFARCALTCSTVGAVEHCTVVSAAQTTTINFRMVTLVVRAQGNCERSPKGTLQHGQYCFRVPIRKANFALYGAKIHESFSGLFKTRKTPWERLATLLAISKSPRHASCPSPIRNRTPCGPRQPRKLELD